MNEEMTLDEAIDAFRANPIEGNAVTLRIIIQEYEADEMITEEGARVLLAWADGGEAPFKMEKH